VKGINLENRRKAFLLKTFGTVKLNVFFKESFEIWRKVFSFAKNLRLTTEDSSQLTMRRSEASAWLASE
jgi:hypothetical protein